MALLTGIAILLAQAAPDTWTVMPELPAPVGEGGGLVATDGETLYLLPGGGSKELWRHTIGGTWEGRASLPDGANGGLGIVAGGAVTHVEGSGNLFLAPGGVSSDFYRYDIAADQWRSLAPIDYRANFPAVISMAGVIDPDEQNRRKLKIFVRVGDQSFVYRRDSTSDTDLGTWGLNLAGSPWSGETQGEGAAMVLSGSGSSGGRFHAIRGGGTRDFAELVQTTGGNVWARRDALPVDAGAGACLVSAMDGSVFCLAGSGSAGFVAYSPGQGWIPMAPAPGVPGSGAGMARPPAGSDVYAVRGGGSREFWSYRFDAPPKPPTMLEQRLADDSAAVAPGEIVDEPILRLKAVVSGAAIHRLSLEAQVGEVGEELGSGTEWPLGAPVSSGQVASVIVRDLEVGKAYHWRVRAVDERGSVSPWVAYQTDPDLPSEVDFRTANRLPDLPQARQSDLRTGVDLAAGALIDGDEPRVLIESVLMAVEGSDPMWLEVEIQPVGRPFRRLATGAGGAVPEGGTATVVIAAPDGAYHWQCRAVNAVGGKSPWISFGKNSEALPDFILESFGGSWNGDRSGCSSSGPGAFPAGILVCLAVILPNAFNPAAISRGDSGGR